MTHDIARHRQPRQHCLTIQGPQREPAPDLGWLVQSPGWTPLDACGVLVTVRYRSADPRLGFGGDWYLSMPLADGDLLLAVGDVTGHGLEAAAEMARIRYAMASLAIVCGEPAGLLSRLNVTYDAAGDDACVLVAERIR